MIWYDMNTMVELAGKGRGGETWWVFTVLTTYVAPMVVEGGNVLWQRGMWGGDADCLRGLFFASRLCGA